MSKIALAFPGIGVKLSGREGRFFEDHRAVVEPFFSAASAIAAEDLTERLTKGDTFTTDTLSQHLFALAFGAGFAEVVAHAGVRVDFCAGFSFGIYAALFATGAVDFMNCARIVVRAHELSSKACRDANAAMAAIVGLPMPEVEKIAAKAKGDVQIVNVITESSVIVAGDAQTVDFCIYEAEKRDALGTTRLPVRVAYHHPDYLGAASCEFALFLRSIPFSSPRVPVVSSIDSELVTTGDGLRDFTADNLGHPIHWYNVVKALAAQGVTTIIEAGAGISLTRNGSFMPIDMTYVNTKNYRRKLVP